MSLRELLAAHERPLFWLGHGIRLAGAVRLIEPFLSRFGVPFITSWQGKDMVRDSHRYFYGHAGVYGHRAANHIVNRADVIVSIGTRMALPQTGYSIRQFAPDAKLLFVETDFEEVAKFDGRAARIERDAGEFMVGVLKSAEEYDAPLGWVDECTRYANKYPRLESPLHDDANGYINSYRFMWELNKWLAEDQVIVTDMGTALLCAYPMLRLNGTQRLITSTGLGEMGFGLPAAIGASIATGKQVLCLNCDGGLQMNLQELATIKHHKLPIKIIVFDNGGYQMIKRSQDAAGFQHTASGGADISFPWWEPLAQAYGMDISRIGTWDDMRKLGGFFASTNAALCIVRMDPEQKFGPKTEFGKSLEVMA
jgi:acetolactate synthase-1/2/3 large subunit